MNLIRTLWPMALAIFLVSCGQDGLNMRTTRTTVSASQSGSITTDAAGGCGCSLQFNPVCGEDHKTYDSACVANCLGVAYTFGACDVNGSLNCASIVQYVCAQPPMPECTSNTACAQVMPSPKAYLNLCQMVEANAVFINNGVCQ